MTNLDKINMLQALVETADELDKKGLTKKADFVTNIMFRLAQADDATIRERLDTTSNNLGPFNPKNPANLSRDIQIYNNYLLSRGVNLANFAKNLEIMVRARRQGVYPAGYNEAFQGLKTLFQDPKTAEGVETFVKQYPQLLADYKLADNLFWRGFKESFIDALKNAKNYSEFETKFEKSYEIVYKLYSVSRQLSKSGHGVISDISKVNSQTLSKIENGLKATKEFETFEKVGQRYLQSRGVKNPLLYTGQELIDKLNSLKAPGDYAKYGGELYKAKNAGEMAIEAQKAAGSITKATPAAEEAATSVSKFLKLGRFAKPLALILSLPSMIEWTKKISSGQMDWNNVDEVLDFVSDCLNFGAAIFLVIGPLGTPLSAALGGISLAIQGGKWLSQVTGFDKSYKPNPEDLKITGQFDKLSPEQKQEYQKEQIQVDNLIEDIKPGYGFFNDYEVNAKKRPIQPPQYAGDKSTYYDPAQIKILDLMNDVFEWAKTKKEYQWLNQPETHSSMIDSFKEKLNNWHREQKKS